MNYKERKEKMSLEAIALEKDSATHIMGILHSIRLQALTHNLKNPDEPIEVPDQSYMILNWMVQATPEDWPMPYSIKEFKEEYVPLKTNSDDKK